MSNLPQPQAAASPAEVMAVPGVLTSRTCWTCPPTRSLHKERVAAAAPERTARGSSRRAAADQLRPAAKARPVPPPGVPGVQGTRREQACWKTPIVAVKRSGHSL